MVETVEEGRIKMEERTEQDDEKFLEKRLLSIQKEMGGEDIVVSLLITSDGEFDIRHVGKATLLEEAEDPDDNVDSDGGKELPKPEGLTTNNYKLRYFG